MTDLFILDTPLQLLNSIEARHHFRNRPSDLVLLLWPGWSPRTFHTLLNQLDWNSVTWISMDATRPNHRYRILGYKLSDQINEYRWTYRQFARRTRLDTILKQSGHVDRLVVGNLLQEYFQYVAMRVPHSELIAVDDGTDTLRVAEQRFNNECAVVEEHPHNYFKRAKRYIRKRWVEWDTAQPKSVCFFTAYDIEPPPQDHIVRNNYRWLRERAAGSVLDNSVYFLGQPLIEDGYLREASYFDYLDRACRYFGGMPLVYIPHKRESAKTVEGVKQKIGLPVTRFDDPIEVALAFGKTRPKVLASFFCSALENCSILFGNTMEALAFYLPKDIQLFDDSPSEDIYDYFRRRETDCFHVVDI